MAPSLFLSFPLSLPPPTDDCAVIQDYLLQLTGARSVPRVFIGGKCVGGGTEVRALSEQNKLVPMLQEVGAL